MSGAKETPRQTRDIQLSELRIMASLYAAHVAGLVPGEPRPELVADMLFKAAIHYAEAECLYTDQSVRPADLFIYLESDTKIEPGDEWCDPTTIWNAEHPSRVGSTVAEERVRAENPDLIYRRRAGGMTRATLENWMRAVYEEAMALDPIRASEVAEAIVGRHVWVWPNLATDQLVALSEALHPIVLRGGRG